MMNYERPMLVKTEQMSEGVYLASGCYTTTAYIHQTPQTGRGDYRIQVDGVHAGDHDPSVRYAQKLWISFNMNVTYVSCNDKDDNLISGDGTSALEIALSYTQNNTDTIGFGDLIVTADVGLAITGVKITD